MIWHSWQWLVHIKTKITWHFIKSNGSDEILFQVYSWTRTGYGSTPMIRMVEMCTINPILVCCYLSATGFQEYRTSGMEKSVVTWIHPVVHGLLTRYEKLRVAHAPGMFSPTPRVSELDMHHGTCVTHVPWCIPGSLTSAFFWSRWRGKRPGLPYACATRNFSYLTKGPWNNIQCLFDIPNICEDGIVWNWVLYLVVHLAICGTI